MEVAKYIYYELLLIWNEVPYKYVYDVDKLELDKNQTYSNMCIKLFKMVLLYALYAWYFICSFKRNCY